ncbi:spore germination protein [Paenibacillus sp. NEAU-GSW1]|uniref:spore germination protein n=1 Tax=Paenibacillus sp. NEAU-GSW1 TaxID=2682486 RepID=UPI0012E26195|nr:spore germination protein [Paenibacillus sp. NEAU-GSW1]MUT65897.1 spore germination protein [Paenibacillus sp. NEAU-GSW1]
MKGNASKNGSKLDSIYSRLSRSDDVVIQDFRTDGEIGHLFKIITCCGMVDMQTFFIALPANLERLAHWIDNGQKGEEDQDSALKWSAGLIGSRMPLDNKNDIDSLYAALFSGSVIVIHNRSGIVFNFDLASQPGRQPEESTMELSLKGPRDGFIENIVTNIALVRRRLRTPDLHCEYWSLGSESQTEVALLYMDGVADPQIVEEARNRLRNIHIKTLHSATQLEDLISDRPYSFFPLVEYIGRPDYVVESLTKGKFALLVDGSPSAIIAPTNLMLLTKSPEDMHLPYYFVSLERLLRLMGLVLALCLPGFWVALSAYNIDQIPFSLLATITISRIGLPVSATMEMFIMLSIFELFREAGVRLPRAVGQTVSVVGGLIVGDAAISAGLTSPTMLVAAAITAVATFTLVNQSLSGTVSILRFFILMLSSLFGIFGFYISVFAVLIYMCSIESFGKPYLAPIAPIKWRLLIPAILIKPWKKRAEEE